jgi:plastocyanin
VTGLRGRTGARRPALAVGVAGVVVAVVVALVASAGVDAVERQPGDVAIEAARMAFPERVEVTAGTVGLWVDNRDPFPHTLLIEGTDVQMIMPANAAVRAEVDLAPGTHRYFCDVPGHEAMEGIIDAR